MGARTICCKLLTTIASAEAFQQTSKEFANACNYILKIAEKEKTSNAIKLHKLCYADIRALFGLSANLAVRAIRRVAGCMKKLKGKRKKPKLFKPKSVIYDARIFSYREKDQTVSLKTVDGRTRVSLILGKYQINQLKGQNPTSATLVCKGKAWYLHIVINCEDTQCDQDGVIGIDLGIKTIATTSTGLQIKGRSRQAFKENRAKIRASLQ